ncbi:hypothetical protein D030_0252B, partial [Vibrio parahaemolyticus AQ3810]
LPVVALRG